MLLSWAKILYYNNLLTTSVSSVSINVKEKLKY